MIKNNFFDFCILVLENFENFIAAVIKLKIIKIKKAMRVEEWFTMFFDEELSGDSLLN